MSVFDNYVCDGQMSIFDLMQEQEKIDKPIRLIELFAGVGSQAMALRNIGADFEHYRMVEFDKYAVASYNAIHGTNFETSDICEVGGVDLGIKETDKYTYIMTYSFPCQDLSVAGKMRGMQKGSGTRSSLLFEVGRLLDEVEELPQVLLMENVPQVLSAKNANAFGEWKQTLEWKGYTNHIQVLNAKDYGVAQSRKRCFMVSILGDKGYQFPKPIPLEKCMKDYLEDEVDEKYYITSEKAKKLIDKLVIGGKILTDRQTDRQLTFASNIPEPYPQQTVSKRDMIQESQTYKQTEAECVNGLGFIDKGTGQHQSNMVYGTDGLMPSEYAVQYKEPMKVVEWKKLNI